MSTILNTNGDKLKIEAIDPKASGNFFVIYAEWNPEVTHALRDGALAVLREAGVAEDCILALPVPGTVELVSASALALDAGRDGGVTTEAVIAIGCVIRGDTPHFDYVCQIAAQGTAALNARGDAPVIFGVLTVDNQQQALDRAGGCLGNKGSEAAAAAVRMANLRRNLQGI